MSSGRKAPKNTELGWPSAIYKGVEAGLLDPVNLDRLEGEPIAPPPDIYSNNLVILPSLRVPDDFPEGQQVWLHRDNYNPCINRRHVLRQIADSGCLEISGKSDICSDAVRIDYYGLWREEDIVAMAAFRQRNPSRFCKGVAHYLKSGEVSINSKADKDMTDNVNRQLMLEIKRRLGQA